MSGRKKLSGSAALATRGDGWYRSSIRGPWEQPHSAGPDVVLDPSVDDADFGTGHLWDDLTRAEVRDA